MTIRRVPGGHYVPKWRDMVAKGRARRRSTRPKRSVLMVQSALRNLKLRYCQEVSFWNPLHRGKHGDLNGGLQWLDFVVKHKRPFVIILDDPSKRWKSYEKMYHENKLKGLNQRKKPQPVILLPANRTSQEYRILIYRFIKRGSP